MTHAQLGHHGHLSVRRTMAAFTTVGAVLAGIAAASPASADAPCSIGDASYVLAGGKVLSPYPSSCVRFYSIATAGSRVSFWTTIRDTRTDGRLAVGMVKLQVNGVWGYWRPVAQTAQESSFTGISATNWSVAGTVTGIAYAACATNSSLPANYASTYLPSSLFVDCGFTMVGR